MADIRYDILIVGAGIFGTSAAYHLSKSHPNPSSVAVIDRTPSPPDHGASTDINKIIRTDYSTRFYMDLAYEAVDAWDTWPELKGKGYYHQTGWLNLGEKGDDLQDRIRRNFRDRGHDPTSDVSFQDVRKICGGIFAGANLEGIGKVYWNPLAGWCDAAAATTELMKVAIERGVQYITGDVQRLKLGSGRIEGVYTSDGKLYTANKIVLATGAWTSKLMTSTEDALDLPEQDRVERQVSAAAVCVAHYKLSPQEVAELRQMPVVIYSDRGDCQPPPSNHLLKLTWAPSLKNTKVTPSGHRISAPPDQDQGIVPKRLKQKTREAIAHQVLPQYTADREEEYWRLCWDAVSPSQDQLITRHPHPELQNLFFTIGGSFHSYKFLPIIGKYIVNVLDGHSNGEEKDQHWAWKSESQLLQFEQGKGAHEKAAPIMELSEMEDDPQVHIAKL
ncbi:MAG: hypothetical protein Q9191_003524 [Dirinaria sp. TL-2023a]